MEVRFTESGGAFPILSRPVPTQPDRVEFVVVLALNYPEKPKSGVNGAAIDHDSELSCLREPQAAFHGYQSTRLPQVNWSDVSGFAGLIEEGASEKLLYSGS